MRLLLSVAALVGLLATGCGSNMVKPGGRLLKKGEPYVPGEGEIVHLNFFPDEEKPENPGFPATVNRADGTFQVLGTEGKGMPPGKYRAAIQIVKNRKDILRGAYGRTNSPFAVEVSSARSAIQIDLDTSPGFPPTARQ